MSLLEFIYLLFAGAMLGLMAIALPRPRGLVPKRLERAWLWVFGATIVTGNLFFFATTVASIFGFSWLSDVYIALLTAWFPQPSGIEAAVAIFGPLSLLTLMWSVTGLGILPFFAWRVVTAGAQNRSYRTA